MGWQYNRFLKREKARNQAIFNPQTKRLRHLNHQRFTGMCRRWGLPRHNSDLYDWLREVKWGLWELIEAPHSQRERNELLAWFFGHDNQVQQIKERWAGCVRFFQEIGPIHYDLLDETERNALKTLVDP